MGPPGGTYKNSIGCPMVKCDIKEPEWCADKCDVGKGADTETGAGNCSRNKNKEQCESSYFKEKNGNGKTCYWNGSSCTYPGGAYKNAKGCISKECEFKAPEWCAGKCDIGKGAETETGPGNCSRNKNKEQCESSYFKEKNGNGKLCVFGMEVVAHIPEEHIKIVVDVQI